MTIRNNIDDVVSEINDVVMGGVDGEDPNDSEIQMVTHLKEVETDHGPFTDEELTYIFNHMVVDGQAYDWVSTAFGVTYTVDITITRV